MKLVALVAALMGLWACRASAALLEDVERLTKQPETRNSEPVIKDSHLGYDLHKDFFYFNDELVDTAYKRSNFNKKTRITLAGQAPDLTGRQVPEAANPFAVGQRCVSQFKSSFDRWDVKENSHGHQFLALYDGKKGSFVVNKLRALLLTRLVNELNDYLPLLDSTANGESEEASESFKRQLAEMVTQIFRDVDHKIREQQADKDDSFAGASVAIVTKHFVVAASLGAGRIVAHDALGNTYPISSEPKSPQDVFGLKKQKPENYQVEVVVNVQPRTTRNYDEDEDDDDELYPIQFLLIETASVAGLMEDKEAYSEVLSQVKSLRDNLKKEQDLYSRSVDHILSAVNSKISMFKRMGDPDHSVILVGLQRDYNKIF